MLMSDEEHFHVSDVPRPCTFAGPDGPEFLRVGILAKNEYYRYHPHTTQVLKRAIRDETTTINQELLRRISDNFVNRLRQ